MIVPLVCEAADQMLDNRQRTHRAGRIAPASAAIFAMLHREVTRAPRAVPLLLEYPLMDLVLVAACALTVDPKLMHALIWHQSGGEP